MNHYTADAINALRRAGHNDLADLVADRRRSIAWAMAEARARRPAPASRASEES